MKNEIKGIMLEEGISEREAVKYLVSNELGKLETSNNGYAIDLDESGSKFVVVNRSFADYDFYFTDRRAGQKIVDILNEYKITGTEYLTIVDYIY